jgi:hypothetical protein
VDGSNPATDWKGYHAPEDLPQLLNPPSGWMQNTNSTPFRATGAGNLDSAAYPKYMVQEPDNIRARASRRLLSSREKFTFEQWSAMAFDTHFLAADEQLPRFFREWDAARKRGDTNATSTAAMVDSLRAWNRAGHTRSIATTWFVLWRERTLPGGGRDTSAAGRVKALAAVKRDMEREYGSALVPWGDIMRHQHPSERDNQKPSDDRPSLPLPTANAGQVGSIFTAGGPPVAGSKKRYAASGHGYVSVVEFGTPCAHSVSSPTARVAIRHRRISSTRGRSLRAGSRRCCSRSMKSAGRPFDLTIRGFHESRTSARTGRGRHRHRRHRQVVDPRLRAGRPGNTDLGCQSRTDRGRVDLAQGGPQAGAQGARTPEARGAGGAGAGDSLRDAGRSAAGVLGGRRAGIRSQATMYAELDRLAPPKAVLASSTSTMDMTEIAQGLPGASRCIVAHPVNPPHVVPVVEVLGGAHTDPLVVRKSVRFMERVGQVPVLLRKFVPGFLLNRMQAAGA